MKDCLSAKTAPDAPNESHLSNNNQRILAPNGALNIVNKNGTLFPWVGDQNSLVFLGEQVSHHPPISAFYAEHVSKKISLNAHIWTKSKFLGLSIGMYVSYLYFFNIIFTITQKMTFLTLKLIQGSIILVMLLCPFTLHKGKIMY